MEKEKVLITAALPYINGAPHLGHIVGCHLPADIFARFQRINGKEVLFVGGTDEHGTPIEISAREVGMDLEEFKSKMRRIHKKIYDAFEISYDIFGYTSLPYHEKFVRDFFLTLYEKGYIFPSKLRMFYCEHDKMFLPGRYVKGTCAYCGYENANGDQCENCGMPMSVDTLLNPKCVLCGNKPVVKETQHLFFDLPKVEKEVKDWLESVKKRHKPLVVEQALAWIKKGLEARCITRDIKNGVKVPLEGFENKTIYVWFDALQGYISFVGWKFGDEGIKNWWKGKAKIYHFLGKDNIPFHAVFWPAMLIAHGGYSLPYRVCGLAYLLYEGKKFSKSKRHGIFCERVIESDINIEELRFYLAFLISQDSDTSFSWNEFKERVNNDLIGNISNFVWRTLHFAKKADFPLKEKYDESMEEFLEKAKRYVEHMEKVEIRKALKDVLACAKIGNAMLNEKEPWKVKDKNKYRKIVYNALEMSRMLAIMCYPFIPKFSRAVFESLGIEKEPMIKDLNKLNIAYREVNLPEKPFFKKISEGDIEKWKVELSKPYSLKELLLME